MKLWGRVDAQLVLVFLSSEADIHGPGTKTSKEGVPDSGGWYLCRRFNKVDGGETTNRIQLCTVTKCYLRG